jgi:hypothetical protein
VHKHPGDGIEVDLHRTLVLGPFGLWMRPEEMMDRAVPFVLGGRRLRRLDDTGMILNVAMHASLGFRPPRLVPLRDVAQISSTGAVDWDTLGRWAAEWRLVSVLQHALASASTTFEIPMPEGSGEIVSSRPRRSDLKALAAYTGTSRSSGGVALSMFRALPGIGPKVGYARALAFPQAVFLEQRARGGTRPSYLTRLRIPARWALRRLRERRRRQRA